MARGDQDPWIGRTVAHYRLLERLGSGGMGVVYKAEDLVLRRHVALKCLRAGRRDAVSRLRLLREARAASALDHPNICTIYEIEETPEGDLFLAMAFCEGESLSARLARGPFDLEEALDLAEQAASGLAHAHSRNVVHRDVKPANLMLLPSGQVKIVDFGVAVRPSRPRLTREGAAVGTLFYMAPEQLRAAPVDHRADIWALGVVLYEMLTGALPFDAPTDESYASAVLVEEPRSLLGLRPDLPPGLWPALARLLAKPPEARPSRIETAVRDLRSCLSTQTLVASPPAPQPAPLEIHPRVAEVFVGREDELAALEQELLPELAEDLPAVVCALQGMPGVGKSYLADRFALGHAGRFAGGRQRLVLDPKTPIAAEALLEELADRLGVQGGAGLAERVRERLRHPRVLLHLENVDSPAAEVVAGRLMQSLRGCTALVTGRLHDLGLALGWRPVRVAAFDEESALRQLWGELGWEPSPAERQGHRELVRHLGYLPLAVHLAAGHLRSGRTATGFLRMLRQHRLAVEPADRAELAVGISEETRKVLATSFELSLAILREEIGGDDRLLAGLQSLGHAPLTGFGRSLGAALAGLEQEDFEELVIPAQKLGLLLPIARQERPDGAWRIHPLLAELLAAGAGPEAVLGRMTEWFVARLPESPAGQGADRIADQGRRWREIEPESAALAWWLQRVPAADRSRVQEAGARYARINGPFHAWIELCEAALRDETAPEPRSRLLSTLCAVALRQGRLDRAEQAALEKLDLDRRRGDELGVAISWELLAETKMRRGELDEALTLYRRQLPVLERLGETAERATVSYHIAYLLKLQERYDEVLQLLREETLPAFEKAGDLRSRAVVLGMIADVLQAQGDLNAALHIRQTEELPLYESLGEARSKAITLGKIAGILHARGEHETALRMRQEQERPIYERMGDTRELAVCLGSIADILRSVGQRDEAIRVRKAEQLPLLEQLGSAYDLLFARESLACLYLERGEPADRAEAATLLHHALTSASLLGLPAEDRIFGLLYEHGLL